MNRDVNLLIKKAEVTEEEAVREFTSQVNRLRERVILAISENEQLDAVTVLRLRHEIDSLVEQYKSKFESLLSENQRKCFVKGIQITDKAIETQNIYKALPYLSESVLQSAQKFGAELITGLLDEVKSSIRKTLQLGVMGQKPISEVVKEIAGKLPGPSVFGKVEVRSEIIVRTELNRIQSLASYERMTQYQKQIPDLMKEWVHSHVGNPRPGHLALDKTVIGADKEFTVIGPDGMFMAQCPHDPVLPAGEVVNCRCKAIPVVGRFRK